MKSIVLMLAISFCNVSIASESERSALLDIQAQAIIHEVTVLIETGKQLTALKNSKDILIKPLLRRLRELYDQHHDPVYEGLPELPGNLTLTYPEEVSTQYDQVEYLINELERMNKVSSNEAGCCDPIYYLLPNYCAAS